MAHCETLRTTIGGLAWVEALASLVCGSATERELQAWGSALDLTRHRPGAVDANTGRRRAAMAPRGWARRGRTARSNPADQQGLWLSRS